MNRDWELVNVFLTHNAPGDVYEAWSRIRAEQGESPAKAQAEIAPALSRLEFAYKCVSWCAVKDVIVMLRQLSRGEHS